MTGGLFSRRAIRERSAPVGIDLLNHIGFTDHAIARFAERADLGSEKRCVVEPILRDLVLEEGCVVVTRPAWARSRHHADLYVQLGEWMLLIGCRDDPRSDRYAIVTVVNGPADNTWTRAHRLGRIGATPPMPRGGRAAPTASIVSAICAAGDRRPGESLRDAFRRVHHERRELGQLEYDRLLLERWHRR